MDPLQEAEIKGHITELMQSLNPVLRVYIAKGVLVRTAKTLAVKYSLGTGQAQALERELTLLLVGIENPEEFAASLTSEAMLSDDMVRTIMTDVNQEVFIPLQKEMEKASQALPTPPKPISPPPPVSIQPVAKAVAPQALEQRGVYAAPLQSPRYPGSQSDIAVNRPAEPNLNILRQQADGIIPQGQRFVPKRPAQTSNPELRSVMANLKMLEDHEEPHIDLHENEAPQNLPGVIVQPSAPVAEQRPTPPASLMQPKPKSDPLIPASPYTTDPYREPIDEEGK